MINNNMYKLSRGRRNQMEENSSSSSPRVSRKDEERGGGGGATSRRRSRYGDATHKEGNGDGGGGGDLIECSGKYCRSCTAGVIADCVALCCCPCALFNLLTLALVKVPWKMGRKCLGLGKKKRKLKRKCNKICSSNSSCNCCSSSSHNTINGHDAYDHGNLRERIRVEEGIWEFSSEEEEEEEGEKSEGDDQMMRNFSARFEAERVWFELYQVGHLGFGRVSFTGI